MITPHTSNLAFDSDQLSKISDGNIPQQLCFIDGKDPVIKEDKEYPDYVLTLTDPLPTKTQLLKLIKEAGGLEGDLTVLGIRNIKRAKRLMGLELVRSNNMAVGK